MKKFRFWETMVGDTMCLFSSKDSEQKAQKTEKDNIHKEVIDAYWIRGNERWHASTLEGLAAQHYYFGFQVCYGKLTRVLKREYCDSWYLFNAYVEDEDQVSVVSDELVYQAVRNNFCWIDTEEEWRSIESNQYYYNVFVPKKVAAALSGKYSESFAMLLAPHSKFSKNLVNKAITLYEEGLSPDMRAYFLLKDIEK